MQQLDMLADPPAHTLARASDPATSHKAAARTTEFSRSHRELVLAALRRFGRAGAEQIAAATRLDAYAVRKRLPELAREGLAERTDEERTTASGRHENYWKALP